tara:strand:+ start:58 stop:1434 length:1377 start_codon:yes stop_codon:yes gene_type:complete
MKPWFEKEKQKADIIKFPEPERKVIKMPSVSEYPDFITGVLDLQARRDQGQIGQDSYDKLYQDLIHRFMKKESFETPWFLRETELNENAVMNTLKKVAALIPIDAKEIYNNVKQKVQNLKQSKESMNEQPTQIDAQQQMEILNQELIGPMIRQTNKLIDTKFEAAQDSYKGQMDDKIRAMVTRPNIGPVNTAEFLNLCATAGVVKTSEMVAEPVLDPTPIPVTSKFQGIFKALFNVMRPGSAAGGQGEFALVFCGDINAKQEKQGDLTLAGKEIELKTSGISKGKATDFVLQDQSTKGVTGPGAMEAKSILKKELEKITPGKVEKNLTLGERRVKQFNALYFPKMGKKKVVAMLSKMYAANYPGQSVSSGQISDGVNDDGTIDFYKLSALSSSLAYDLYKSKKNFHGVMMLNAGTMNYTLVIDGKDLLAVRDRLKISAIFEFLRGNAEISVPTLTLKS